MLTGRDPTLKDINPGAGDSSPTGFATLDGAAYFYAWSGTAEVWRTDGTEIGTVAIAEEAPAWLDLRNADAVPREHLLLGERRGP